MPNGEENLKQLHKNLSSKVEGFNKDFESFKKDMSDPEKRKRLHKNMPKFFKGFNRNYEQFSEDLGFKKKDQPKSEKPSGEKQEKPSEKRGEPSPTRDEPETVQELFEQRGEKTAEDIAKEQTPPQISPSEEAFLDFKNQTAKSEDLTSRINEGIARSADDPRVQRELLAKFRMEEELEPEEIDVSKLKVPESRYSLDNLYKELYGELNLTEEEIKNLKPPTQEELNQYLKTKQAHKDKEAFEKYIEGLKKFKKEQEAIQDIKENVDKEETARAKGGLSEFLYGFQKGEKMEDQSKEDAYKVARTVMNDGLDSDEFADYWESEYRKAVIRMKEKGKDYEEPDLFSWQSIGSMVGSEYKPMIKAGAAGSIGTLISSPVGGMTAAGSVGAVDAALSGFGGTFRQAYFDARMQGNEPERAREIALKQAYTGAIAHGMEGALGAIPAFKGLGKFVSKSKLVRNVAGGAMDVGVDAAVAGGAETTKNIGAQLQGLDRDVLENTLRSMVQEGIFSIGTNIPNISAMSIREMKNTIAEMEPETRQQALNKIQELKQKREGTEAKQKAETKEKAKPDQNEQDVERTKQDTEQKEKPREDVAEKATTKQETEQTKAETKGTETQVQEVSSDEEGAEPLYVSPKGENVTQSQVKERTGIQSPEKIDQLIQEKELNYKKTDRYAKRVRKDKGQVSQEKTEKQQRETKQGTETELQDKGRKDIQQQKQREEGERKTQITLEGKRTQRKITPDVPETYGKTEQDISETARERMTNTRVRDTQKGIEIEGDVNEKSVKVKSKDKGYDIEITDEDGNTVSTESVESEQELGQKLSDIERQNIPERKEPERPVPSTEIQNIEPSQKKKSTRVNRLEKVSDDNYIANIKEGDVDYQQAKDSKDVNVKGVESFTTNQDGKVGVYDKKTGMKISEGETESEAIDNAKNVIEHEGKDFKRKQEQFIEETGKKSPAYKDRDEPKALTEEEKKDVNVREKQKRQETEEDARRREEVKNKLKEKGLKRKEVITSSRPEFKEKHGDKFDSEQEADEFYDEVRDTSIREPSMKSRKKIYEGDVDTEARVLDKTKKQVRSRRTARKVTEKTISKIKKAFPNVEVVTDKALFPSDLKEGSGYRNGKVFIDLDNADMDTPIEEFGHLWIDIADKHNSSVINTVSEDIKDTEYFQDVKNEEGYQNLTEKEQIREALARVIRDRGAEKLERSKARRILDKIWDTVRKALYKMGLESYAHISGMNLRKFANKASREILSGIPITEASSIDIDNALNNRQKGVRIEIDNSILSENKNENLRWFVEKWNEYMRTSRGMDLRIRNEIEGHANRKKAISAEIKHISSNVFDYMITKYRNNNGNEKAEQLIRDIGEVFYGKKALTDLPEEFQQPVHDFLRIRDEFTDIIKEEIEFSGEVVLNHELQLYLTEKFNIADELTSIESEMADQHREEIAELNSIKRGDANALQQKYDEYVERKQAIDKEIKQLKLKELKGKRKQIENMAAEDTKTAELKRKLDEAEGRLKNIKQRKGLAEESTQKDKELKQIQKKIEQEQEQIQKLLDDTKNLTPAQLEIAEQIEDVNNTISEITEEKKGEVDFKGAEKLLESIHRAEIKSKRKQYDLERVDFVNYNVDKDNQVFDIKFNHRDGSVTKVNDVDASDMINLFGRPAVQDMYYQGEGVHNMNIPQILTNNRLYERIKSNEGRYVTRSYMKHDFEDFSRNVKKYIGEENYNKARDFLFERFSDQSVNSVRKVLRQDGGIEYVFKNIYDIESDNMQVNDIDAVLRDMDVSEKDIRNFKDTDVDVEYTFQSPTIRNHSNKFNFAPTAEELSTYISKITESGNFDNKFGGGKIKYGLDDTKITKKRQDISEPIRKLMGEYTDPRINIEKTLMNGMIHAEERRFHRQILNEGLGKFISTKQTKEHTEKVTEGDSEVLGNYKEKGQRKELYMTPEVYNFLFEKDITQAPKWLKTVLTLNGLVKMNFTVFRGASQTRNAWGALMNLQAAAGSTRTFQRINEAYRIASQDFDKSESWSQVMSTPLAILRMYNNKTFGDKSNAELREAYKEMVEAGFTESDIESASFREMQEVIKTSKDPKNIYQKVTRKIGKGAESLSKTYQMSDVVPKIAQYMIEKEDYIEAGYSEKDAKEIAREIVKNTQPHYQRAPKFFRGLSRNPVVGAFVMFKAEMFRTRANIVKQAYKEINSGNEVLKNKGIKRLSGLAFQSLFSGGLHYTSMFMAGISGDEDEAFRDLMPWYAKNNAYVYLNDDMTSPKYLDFTFIDPGSAFTNAAIGVLREGSTTEKTSRAWNELFGEFFGKEILLDNLQRVLYNEDGYGQEIWEKNDTETQKWQKIGKFLGEQALAPKEFTDIWNIISSFGENDDEYYDLNPSNEIMNRLLGIKIKERTVINNVKYGLEDQMELIYQTRHDYEEGEDSEQMARRKISKYFKRMREIRNNALDLGFGYGFLHGGDRQEGFLDKETRLPKYMIRDIENGYLSERGYDLKKEQE